MGACGGEDWDSPDEAFPPVGVEEGEVHDRLIFANFGGPQTFPALQR
jgi:hypothetical protein